MANVHVLDHPLIQHKLAILRDKETPVKEFRELVGEIAGLMCYEATRNLPTTEVTVQTPVAEAKCRMLSGKKLAIVPVLRAGLGMVDSMVALIPSAKIGHIGLYRDPETHKPVEYYCKLPEDVETPVATAHCKMLAGKKLAIVPVLRAGLGMVDSMVDLIPSAKIGHIGLYRDPETHMPVEYYCKLPDDIANRQVFVVDPMLATGGSAIAAIDFLKQHGCRNIIMMNIIGCPEGVKAVQEAHPDVELYLAAVDEKLNERAYIVPGLGDAGDRIFGTK